ncbi:APC family permease [Terrihalobacillus insolitus]|uniref:APC family permease n=1 Tax=Terrihalobacillus insolitus TaxID=2950438 RepID=UPI002341B069|nr:APC family permease [Terrihalobacillus insolitus]MDC3412949.1 APC family permease [Terrihalobacillus insolitus]
MEMYKKNSITLTGAVGLGTGVMIGAGIFALLGQVAELAGTFFPITFLIGAIVTFFSAYSYIKLSNAYPSAGGIATFLIKAYGKGTIAAASSLMMAVSMVINESLVARTFGVYTLQLFNVKSESFLVPVLGVALLAFAFVMNISGNRLIETFSSITSLLKIGGIAVFAFGGLWVSKFTFESFQGSAPDQTIGGYVAAVALTILAFKGFTTITNSGSEIVKPHRNVGRAIIFSILIVTVIYVLVAWAVASNLSLDEIIQARDFSLAEAARPAFGKYGLWFTVGIAIIATVSGVVASVFAVSRMTAMLTDMKLIPHSHFGMPGSIQKHMVVYTIVIAAALTILFDLSRIASLGAILYLVMDIILHWGVLRHLRNEIKAKSYMLVTALVFDVIVLGAFLWVKAQEDIVVIVVSLIMMVAIFVGERFFIQSKDKLGPIMNE